MLVRLQRGTVLSLFVLVVFLSFLSVASAQTEQITLTTYYPAPFGIYQELAARRMKIGVNYMLNTTTVADNTLIVEGNIGIGIAAPTRPLTIVSPSGQSAIQIQSQLGAGQKTGINFIDIDATTPQTHLELHNGMNAELRVVGYTHASPPAEVSANMVVTGNYYEYKNNKRCMRVPYSSASGRTYCPPGHVIDTSLSSTSISGAIYCCAP